MQQSSAISSVLVNLDKISINWRYKTHVQHKTHEPHLIDNFYAVGI